jgi:hypothetical protein
MERTAKEYGAKPGGFSAELVASLLDVRSERERGGEREKEGGKSVAKRASAARIERPALTFAPCNTRPGAARAQGIEKAGKAEAVAGGAGAGAGAGGEEAAPASARPAPAAAPGVDAAEAGWARLDAALLLPPSTAAGGDANAPGGRDGAGAAQALAMVRAVEALKLEVRQNFARARCAPCVTLVASILSAPSLRASLT